jgi:chromosomal replication initiation ATPase DnaA
MTTQLTFALPLPVHRGRDDFWLADSNRQAFQTVLSPWEGVVWLQGVEGSGKTHLAHIWAVENEAVFWPPVQASAIVIDNAERLVGDTDAEAALFHAINAKARLLLTSRYPLETLVWHTPDLASRLRLAQTAHLHAPTLDLMEAVLMKIFHDRQMRVHPRFIKVIAHRLEASLTQAEKFIARLDALTLAHKQAVHAKSIRAALAAIAEEDIHTDSEKPCITCG